MNVSKLAPGLAVTLTTAGLALAFIVTQHIRLGPDPSTAVPPGVSASVPPQSQPTGSSGMRAISWSLPVRVVIPAVNVNATIMEVGQNKDGTVQTPPLGNHNLAGWYKYSVTPGQTGSSVVVGHVDSYTGPSVFFNLKELHSGDRVEIRLANGITAVFAVDGLQVAAKTSFPVQAVFGNTKFPSLRLVTCGGPFDYGTGHYVDNIVVYAHLVGTLPGTPRQA
ncbi:MAG TPA: class F sortase [Streptosporangiaceae bacterium]